MRDWIVGDPVGDGNDIGVPDVSYMDYLKEDDEKDNRRKPADFEKFRIFREEASRLIDEDKFRDALAFIDAAIRIYPQDGECWNQRGIILLNMLEVHGFDVGFEAHDCFNRALEIDSSNKTFKLNRGKFLLRWALKLIMSDDYAFAQSRVEKALPDLEDKNSIDYADALWLKGLTHQRYGEYDDALECFDNALEICPDADYISKSRYELLDSLGYGWQSDLF